MLETGRRHDVWPFGNPKCPHCGNEARYIGGDGTTPEYDCPTCKRRNRERRENEELRARVARLEATDA
jgi:tRNA(Ile2) C34 agmatinyltransferase TiaS